MTTTIISISIGYLVTGLFWGYASLALSRGFTNRNAPYFFLGFLCNGVGFLMTAIDAYVSGARERRRQTEYLKAI